MTLTKLGRFPRRWTGVFEIPEGKPGMGQQSMHKERGISMSSTKKVIVISMAMVIMGATVAAVVGFIGCVAKWSLYSPGVFYAGISLLVFMAIIVLGVLSAGLPVLHYLFDSTAQGRDK